jgi:iron complex transport system permease protein
VNQRRRPVYIALSAALVLFSLLSLIAGKVWVPWSAWFTHAADPRWAIVSELRLPRTILAVAIGAALGMSGAALQGYTRNPLADPGLLGVSSMAALGAVLTIYFGLSARDPWLLSAAGMAGAGLGVAILLLLSGATGGVIAFLLAGVILSTLSSAAITLALGLAPSPWAVNEIVNWLMGSLQDRSIEEVRIALPFIAAGCAILIVTGRALDALTLGDSGAQALGIDIGRTRLLLVLGLGLATGASVAVTGVISFVGLIVPHLLRPLVGARPAALLLPSALAGAVLVLAADILVRLTPAAVEIKLGAAMAALGAPFFLFILISLRRKLA